MIVVAVAVAAAFGSLGRFAVGRLVHPWRDLPLATHVVNVVGSFAVGLLVGLVRWEGLDGEVRTVVGTGLLGGFTTFSALAVETVELGGRRPGAAAVNVVGGVLASLAAASAGMLVASLL